MVKELAFNYDMEKSVNSPEQIVDLLNHAFHMSDLTEEYVYMLAMDTKCHLIGVFEVAHESSTCAIVSTKSLYERALLCGATGIVVAHNHPSNNPYPSQADRDMCKQIKEAGNLLDINLLDFLVIGKPDFISFQMENLMI